MRVRPPGFEPPTEEMAWLRSLPPGVSSDASVAKYASMRALPTCSDMPIEEMASKFPPVRWRYSWSRISTRSVRPAASTRWRASSTCSRLMVPPTTSPPYRSEEHTSEIQSLTHISYAVAYSKNKIEKDSYI